MHALGSNANAESLGTRARPAHAATKAVRFARNVVLLLVGTVMFAPFWWTIAIALGPSSEAFAKPPRWIPHTFTLENFDQVLMMIPFGRQVLNSLIVTGIVTVGSLFFSVLAAYAFARLRFPAKEAIFAIFLTALMIPPQVTLIPLFIIMRYLGLLDELPSLWLPGLIQVFSIFLLRQHFSSVPLELDDAATLDGASKFRIAFQIYLPLSVPILSAAGIYTMQVYWNDYLNPVIFISSPEKMTVPVGLVSLQNAFGTTPAVVVFAGVSMVVVPLFIIFLFLQEPLTKGISMSGARR